MRIRDLAFAAPGITALALFSCVCKPPPETGAPPPTGEPSPPAEPAPAPPPATGDRTPMIAPDNPHYARVEGQSFENACQTDADCFVGGCSSEVCTAQQGVASTCILPEGGWPSAGGACGCVAGQCQWYQGGAAPGVPEKPAPPDGETDDGQEGEPAPSTEPAAAQAGSQGRPCVNGTTCNDGLECVSYYGYAGKAGPKFTSCEIRCTKGKGSCPSGQSCVTIADGPGNVCR